MTILTIRNMHKKRAKDSLKKSPTKQL